MALVYSDAACVLSPTWIFQICVLVMCYMTIVTVASLQTLQDDYCHCSLAFAALQPSQPRTASSLLFFGWRTAAALLLVARRVSMVVYTVDAAMALQHADSPLQEQWTSSETVQCESISCSDT